MDPTEKGRVMKAIVDLSLPVYTGLPVVPGTNRQVIIERTMTFDTPYKRNTSSLALHSHMCSTHIDAPLHAIEDGHGIDQYSLGEQLIGEAFHLDLTQVPPGHRISVNDLDEAEQRRGEKVPAGCMLCLNTSWTDKTWGQKEFFDQMISLDAPATGDWLLGRRPKAILFDCYNDYWEGFMTSDCFRNHVPLLGAGIPFIEFCCNLAELKTGRWEIIALPLKIVDCDGSPARVIARALD